MNYKVSAASPTDELITLGQILSEVGGYASTFLDRKHLSFARKCAERLENVVCELISRCLIQSSDDLHEIMKASAESKPLSAMSVGELHNLYRQWPLRHEQRFREGREHLTFFYEARIIRELQTRRALTKDERLKIDYCLATYQNELDNLSQILNLSLTANCEKTAREGIEGARTAVEITYPDPFQKYSPSFLASQISLLTPFRSIEERELLIEYTDLALDLLAREGLTASTRPLLQSLSPLKGLIRLPMVHSAL